MNNPIRNILIRAVLVLLAFAEAKSAEILRVTSYDTRLSGTYIICNNADLEHLTPDGPDTTSRGGEPFPVLQLNGFFVYSQSSAVAETPPPDRSARCQGWLNLYRPVDVSRFYNLPRQVAVYLEKRFFAARRFRDICWYINPPHEPQPQQQEGFTACRFNRNTEHAAFVIYAVPGAPSDKLTLDLAVNRATPLSVPQILLLEYLFYDFLSGRLASGAFRVESPLQFLSSPSVPVYMPDLLISARHASMKKLLKKWNKIESSFLKSLSLDYISEVRRELMKQLLLYTTEPVPRLTVMSKLLAKHGSLRTVTELQSGIAQLDISRFLKTVADVFRHSDYRLLWITGGTVEKGVVPMPFTVAGRHIKEQ